MSQLNIELFEQVKAKIRKEPESFNMDKWGGKNDCGTQACIAGWAIALAYPGTYFYGGLPVKPDGGYIASPRDTAAEVLGITRNEANDLFYRKNWPDDLLEDWYSTHTKAEEAEVACEVIDRFIKRKTPAS